MAIVTAIDRCPNCRYAGASTNFDCRNNDLDLDCIRCGFWFEDTTERYTEGGGVGSYVYRKKGPRDTYGSLGKVMLASLRERVADNLDELEVCSFTFEEAGEWHVRDLLTGNVTLFSESESCNSYAEDTLQEIEESIRYCVEHYSENFDKK